LRRIWRFDGGDNVPAPEDVTRVLERVGWQRVHWERPRVTLAPGMEIDFGGIGKEYAVDRCIGILAAADVGPGLVNFGGDLAVTGPPTRRKAWSVAVEGRRDSGADHVIELRHGALATSGDARRYVLRDGVRYGHILDATTGWPVAEAPASVTVAADTCTQAGMLSTLAMLRGVDAEAFLGGQDVLHWCRR
jgi:thiamine biosynthesis lipoprotein